MKPAFAFALSAAIGAGSTIAAFAAQPPAAAPTPAPVTPVPPPIVEGAHWHHIHINATNPAAAADFYPKHFKAEKVQRNGAPAVWTQKSWMLFSKVSAPPSTKLNTAIWHIGWGTTDPKNEYKRQQTLGAKFFTPLTDISTGLNGFAPDSFYYMYVEGPDRELIELNTAQHNNFGHMHMFSADPVAAGDWYIKTFGVRGRLSTAQTNRSPCMNKTGQLQIGPSASINFDNVNMIIYPVEYARKAYAEDWVGVTELQSTRGSVNDHIGISVPDLDKAAAALKAAGVKFTLEPRRFNDQVRIAFIEGPDKAAIELVEDKSPQPPAS